MTTVRLGDTPGLEQLKFDRDPPLAAPGPGEVRVRVQANSLNYHDYGVAMGWLPSRPGRILLSDGAGVVEAVGKDVVDLAEGDAVVSCFFPQWRDGDAPNADFSQTPGDGLDGYASPRVVRPAQAFTRAPRGMSALEAATLPTAAVTAWRALVVNGGIKAGDTVLVLGSGGVSMFALQFARMMDAEVIATSSSDAKLERLRALGASHTVNYNQVPAWGEAVRDLTGGRGVDHVVEIGGPGTLAQSIQACRIGGHIALIGVLTGIAGEVPTAALMARQQRLHGVTVGSRRHQLDMIRALDASGMKPIIDGTYGLESLTDAFRHLQSGAHFGKIGVSIEA